MCLWCSCVCNYVWVWVWKWLAGVQRSQDNFSCQFLSSACLTHDLLFHAVSLPLYGSLGLYMHTTTSGFVYFLWIWTHLHTCAIFYTAQDLIALLCMLTLCFVNTIYWEDHFPHYEFFCLSKIDWIEHMNQCFSWWFFPIWLTIFMTV